MKKTISIASVLFFALFIMSISSCKKDDPADDVLYNVKVQNDTDNDYDFYLKSDVGGTSFKKEGHVSAHGTLMINDLTIQVNYTFRVVAPGNSVDDFDLEETFTSDNNVDDYVLILNP